MSTNPHIPYTIICHLCVQVQLYDIGLKTTTWWTSLAYIGSEHSFWLQARLMARGLGMLAQSVRCTILPSDFLRHPKRVYCFPASQTNRQKTTIQAVVFYGWSKFQSKLVSVRVVPCSEVNWELNDFISFPQFELNWNSNLNLRK